MPSPHRRAIDAVLDAEFSVQHEQQKNPGRVPVAIKITDPAFDEYELPGGVFGQAAIYSEYVHHIAMLRRILLRMSAWMNYVFPFH